MLDQATPSIGTVSEGPAELGNLDLRTVTAETVNVDGDLVLVVTDEDSQVFFNPGAGADAMAAVRGALKLASAASGHARQLSICLNGRGQGAASTDDESGVHVPARPSWVCSWCAQPWPCSTGRRRLAAEYEDSPTSLYVLMTLRFAEATADLSVAELPSLHRRFLGWIAERASA